MKTEQYVYAGGQIVSVKPVAQTDVATRTIGLRTHDSFTHAILLVTDEKWPYPFVIRTRLQVPTTGVAPETVYLAYTWFTKLADLLEYLARYLPPEQVGMVIPSEEKDEA